MKNTMKPKTKSASKPVTAPNHGLLYFVLDRSRKEAHPIRLEVVSQALPLIAEKTIRKKFYDWSLDYQKAQEALDRYAATLRELADKSAAKLSVKKQMVDHCFAQMKDCPLPTKLWFVSYAASLLAPHLNGEASLKKWKRCDKIVRAVETRFTELLQKLPFHAYGPTPRKVFNLNLHVQATTPA